MIMVLEIVIIQQLLHYLSSPISTLVVLEAMDLEQLFALAMTYIKNFLTVGFPHCLSHKQHCILIWRVVTDFLIWAKLCKVVDSSEVLKVKIHYKVAQSNASPVQYVTGFGKTCIVHTSNFSTVVTHKISLERQIDVKLPGIIETLLLYCP